MSTTYKLEVWGARSNPAIDNSRSINIASPLAGYSHGIQSLSLNKNIYICIGGAGNSNNALTGGAGGYNGGGKGGNGVSFAGGAGGGGATHIASTNRGILKNYSSYKSEVYIVAGGSGGAAVNGRSDGVGGGVNGGNALSNGHESTVFYVYGGTQSTGYAFGQGENAINNTNGGTYGAEGYGGGGGGWYGGHASQVNGGIGSCVAGAGGSGYIGGVVNGYTQAGVNSPGNLNGYAIISWHPSL